MTMWIFILFLDLKKLMPDKMLVEDSQILMIHLKTSNKMKASSIMNIL